MGRKAEMDIRCLFKKREDTHIGFGITFHKKEVERDALWKAAEFKITPLTFKEFVDFKGQKAEPIGIYEHELERAMPEFMRTQGFPELVGKINPAYIKKYITEGISDKVLYKDIPEMFGIRNTDALGAILRILMDAPGQVIDYAKLAKELGISRYSVSKYLGYLEDAFIVRKMYNYSRNIRKSERSLRKYYPTIISTELAFKDDALYQSKSLRMDGRQPARRKILLACSRTPQ